MTTKLALSTYHAIRLCYDAGAKTEAQLINAKSRLECYKPVAVGYWDAETVEHVVNQIKACSLETRTNLELAKMLVAQDQDFTDTRDGLTLVNFGDKGVWLMKPQFVGGSIKFEDAETLVLAGECIALAVITEAFSDDPQLQGANFMKGVKATMTAGGAIWIAAQAKDPSAVWNAETRRVIFSDGSAIAYQRDPASMFNTTYLVINTPATIAARMLEL